MNLMVGDLEVEVLESTPENEDEFGGRWGWFWHASIMRPRGPFGTAPEAVRDLADWMERHTNRPPPTAETVLVDTMMKNAAAFLDAALEGGGDGSVSEVALVTSCKALELIMDAYLLSRGRPGDAMQRDRVADLGGRLSEAAHLGMPNDDARIERFVKAVGRHYARNELAQLLDDPRAGIAKIGFVMAIRSLHREVERSLAP